MSAKQTIFKGLRKLTKEAEEETAKIAAKKAAKEAEEASAKALQNIEIEDAIKDPLHKSLLDDVKIAPEVIEAPAAPRSLLEIAEDPNYKRLFGKEANAVEKSAADSAKILDGIDPNGPTKMSLPNFGGTLVGDPTPGVPASLRPNFKMQGEPYSGNVPSTAKMTNFDMQGNPYSGNVPSTDLKFTPSKSLVPSSPRALNTIEDVVVRDVSEAVPKKAFPWKTAAGVGGLAAGAGVLASLGGSDPQQALAEVPPMLKKNDEAPIAGVKKPTEAPVAKQAVKSSEKAVKATEPPVEQPHNPLADEILNGNKNPLMNIDFGNNFKDSAAALQEVQDRENTAVLINQLGKSGELLGTAFSRAKPVAQGLFDDNIKQAGNITKQYEARMAKEKDDPNSPMSKGMKQFLKSFGYNVQGDASASDLLKIYPIAERYAASVEAANVRKLTAKMHREEMDQKNKDRKEAEAQRKHDKSIEAQHKSEEKKEAQDLRRIDNFGKIATGSVTARGPLGQEVAKLDNIKHVQALLKGYKNLDEIPSIMLTEVAISFNRVLSSVGAPPISITHELTPHNLKRLINDKISWLKSKPIGAGQKDYMKMFEHALDRQEEVTKENMARHSTKLLAPIQDLKDHPNVQAILFANGLPPDLFEYMNEKREDSTEKFKEYIKQGYSRQEALKKAEEPTKDSTAPSQKTVEIINSRTPEENKKRLEELRSKYGSRQ